MHATVGVLAKEAALLHATVWCRRKRQRCCNAACGGGDAGEGGFAAAGCVGRRRRWLRCCMICMLRWVHAKEAAMLLTVRWRCMQRRPRCSMLQWLKAKETVLLACCSWCRRKMMRPAVEVQAAISADDTCCVVGAGESDCAAVCCGGGAGEGGCAAAC
jgi:hypothetical protein